MIEPFKFNKKISSYQYYILFSYSTIFINILSGLIIFPLLLKSEGIKSLGVFGVLFALKSIFDIVVSGTSSGFVKNLIKYNYFKNDIFLYSILFHFSYGLICFILLLIFGNLFYEDYFLGFLYFSFFIVINFLTNSFYEMFLSINKQHIVAFFRFLLQMLFFISILLLFLFDILTLNNIFMGLFLVSLGLFFFVFYIYQTNFKLSWFYKRINLNIIKKIFLKDGYIYLLHTLTISLLFHLDVLLIDYLYGSAIAGIYLIIFKIPNTIIILGFRLSEPFRVIVANNIKNKQFKVLNQNFLVYEKRILFFSFILGALYLFFGENILVFWLGSENIPKIEFMYIICSIVIILSIMQEFYTATNFYTKNLNKVVILNFMQLMFKLFFILFLFDNFKELSSLIAWALILITLIYFYRENSLKVLFNEEK